MRKQLLLITAACVLTGSIGGEMVLNAVGTKHGQLTVVVSDLPASSWADVQLSGPGMRSRHLTKTTTFDVQPGSYVYRAKPVRGDGATYYVAPPQGSVAIAAGENRRLTVDYSVLVPTRTKVVDLDHLRGHPTIDVSSSQLAVGGRPTEMSSLRPGDVVVSGVTSVTPEGMIRRVDDVLVGTHEVLIRTSPATLRDAVSRARVDVHATFDDSVNNGAKVTDSGSAARSEPQTYRLASASGAAEGFERSDLRLLAQGRSGLPAASQLLSWNGGCSVAKAIEPKASFHIRPTLDFNLDWGFLGPRRISFDIGLQQDAVAYISAHYKARCELNARTQSIRLGVIPLWIGPVPVVITPELFGEGSISGETTANTVLGASESFAVGGGFVLDHGTLQFTHRAAPSLTWFQSNRMDATASIMAGPVLRFVIDGLTGPEVALRFEVDASVKPTGAQLVGKIALLVRVHLDFLGFHFDKDSGDLISYSRLLAQWTSDPPTANPHPQPSQHPAPPLSTPTPAPVTQPTSPTPSLPAPSPTSTPTATFRGVVDTTHFYTNGFCAGCPAGIYDAPQPTQFIPASRRVNNGMNGTAYCQRYYGTRWDSDGRSTNVWTFVVFDDGQQGWISEISFGLHPKVLPDVSTSGLC